MSKIRKMRLQPWPKTQNDFQYFSFVGSMNDIIEQYNNETLIKF